MRALSSLWTSLLVGTLFCSTLGSGRDVQRSIHHKRQFSKQFKASPAYAKVSDLQTDPLYVSSVENVFHRQYQEHKERLRQPIVEEQHYTLSPKQRQHLHEERAKLMAVHFEGLRDSKLADRPLFLNGINQLRHPTQAFANDAGASLKLGETWKFEQHGPYPALRLASLASHNSPSRYMSEELSNADRAIRLQTELDKSDGTYRGLVAYTDDLPLLKSARQYFTSAYAQRDWRGTVLEELELIGERSVKRLRL